MYEMELIGYVDADMKIYCKELAQMIMEAKGSPDLHSASWRLGSNGVI